MYGVVCWSPLSDNNNNNNNNNNNLICIAPVCAKKTSVALADGQD